MHLQVTNHAEILLDEPVLKVVAEGPDGAFCLLPQHVDWVMALVPGIVTIHRSDGHELFLATGAGLLVKQGHQVSIATPFAATASALGELAPYIAELFDQDDSAEQHSRDLLGRLEMTFMRHFIDLKEAV